MDILDSARTLSGDKCNLKFKWHLPDNIVSAEAQWVQVFPTCDYIANYCYLSTNIELQMITKSFLLRLIEYVQHISLN